MCSRDETRGATLGFLPVGILNRNFKFLVGIGIIHGDANPEIRLISTPQNVLKKTYSRKLNTNIKMSSKKIQKTSSKPMKKVPENDEVESSDDDEVFGMFSAFKKQADVPVQRVRVSSNGGTTSKPRLQGMIMETSMKYFDRKNSSVKLPKKELIVPCPMISGDAASDLILSGKQAFLLPTMKVDEGEEGQETKGERVVVWDGPGTRGRKIDGCVRVTLYTESLKSDKENDVARMKVGDIVEIWGLEAALSPTNDGRVYLNASGGKILQEGPAPAHLPRHILTYCMDRQDYTMFLASMNAGGFFNTDGYSTEQKKQASIIQKMWESERDGAAFGFQNVAASKPEEIAGMLKEKATMVKQKDAAFYANGGEIMFKEDSYDFSVLALPLVGMSPKQHKKIQGNPALLKRVLDAVKDQNLRKSLPSSMHASVITKVEFPERKESTGFVVHINGVAIPDVKSAITALEENMQEQVGLMTGTILCEQTLKYYSQFIGSRDPAFVRWALQEILPGCATGGLFAKALKPTGNPGNVLSDWPVCSGIKLDMRETLVNCSIVVSENFVKNHLCGGNTQFIGERIIPRNSEGLSTALPAYHIENPINWKEHGVHELTSQSWKLSMLDVGKFDESTSNTKREFRVIFPDVRNLLANDDRIRTDAKAGEAMIEAFAADNFSPSKSVEDFLTQDCLAYAIAVEGNEA